MKTTGNTKPRQQSDFQLKCLQCGKTGKRNTGVEVQLIKCPDCGMSHKIVWDGYSLIMSIDTEATDDDVKRQGQLPSAKEDNAANQSIEMRLQPKIPDEIVSILEGKSGKYADFRTIYHALELGIGIWVGVVGDGDNGIYERFRYSGGALTISSAGYGDPCIALRDAINAFCCDRNI